MSLTPRAFALLSLSCAASLAMAQATPDGQWHGGATVGGAFASGNTSSRVISGSVDGVRATAADQITLYGVANYANSKVDDTRSTTANLVRLGGRYDYNLSSTVFAFGGAEIETNRAAGLQKHYGLNAGLGYKLIRTDVTSWDLFGGVGYDDTKYTDASHVNGAVFLLGEESSHKLSATTTFKQRLVLFPGAKSSVGNRATFDAGLATAIAGAWTMNLGLAVRYASETPVDVKSTDSLLTVGFGYKY